MITYTKTQSFRADGTQMVEIYGLSTDTKPTSGISNASAFIEMDTGGIYLYDEENSLWLLFSGGGGGS